MKWFLPSWVVLAFLPIVGQAQRVGDSEPAVLKALGNPPMTRVSGDRLTWMYPNGTKVIFEGGVVVEVKAASVDPLAPAVESTAPEPTPRVALPKPPFSRVTATPQAGPQTNAEKLTWAKRTLVSLVVMLIGLILMLICGIIILIEAFRASVLWGLASIFIPFAQLIFVFTHWSETKKPFLLSWLVGFPLALVGASLG